MFRQFTYRLVPLMLGLIPGSPPRGGTTITEVADHGIDQNLTDEVDRPDRGDVPGWVLITLMTGPVASRHPTDLHPRRCQR